LYAPLQLWYYINMSEGDGAARLSPDGTSVLFGFPLSIWAGKEVRFADRDWEPLTSFVQLAGASPEKIVNFANTWGPLGLCKHGQPYDHGDHNISIDALGRGGISLPLFCPPRFYEPDDVISQPCVAEPLSAWRHLAAAAQALRDTVVRLRHGDRPLQRDVTTLTLTLFGYGHKLLRALAGTEAALERNRRGAWFLVHERLNEWLASAPVRFFCEMDEQTGRFDVDFTVGLRFGLLPVIAAQLLATLAGHSGKAMVCAGCGLPFVSAREPSRGRRRYCWPCRKADIAVRDAVHAYRDRVRRARSLRAEGKSVAEISDLLGIKETQVKRYLAKEA
jgi:hypothetical protein